MDAWNFVIAPGPLVGRGEMAMSPPRCARLVSPRTATSARTLVHVAQSVPQVRAVPNIKRQVFGSFHVSPG